MLIAPVLAFIAFLFQLNVERAKETSWGDSFLRAFTRAVIAYVLGCVIEGIILLLLMAYSAAATAN